MSDSTDVIAPPEEPPAAESVAAQGEVEAAAVSPEASAQVGAETKTEPDPQVDTAKADDPAKADDAPKADDATKVAVAALRKARDTHANVEGLSLIHI